MCEGKVIDRTKEDNLFAEQASLSRYIRRAFAKQYRRRLIVLVVVIILLTAVILLAQQVSRPTSLASNVVSGLFLAILALLILVLFAGPMAFVTAAMTRSDGILI